MDRHTALTVISDALHAQVGAIVALDDRGDTDLVMAVVQIANAIDRVEVAADRMVAA